MMTPKVRTLRNPFRTDSMEHELLKREAYDRGMKETGKPFSFNDIVCLKLFGKGDTHRLSVLRAKQRRAGIPDRMFLHRSEKRARGLVAKPGRPSWRV